MRRKVYTVYKTNRPNILGGFMTYQTLEDAMNALDAQRGVNTITAVTYVDADWWHGKRMGWLIEVLSSGVIYQI